MIVFILFSPQMKQTESFGVNWNIDTTKSQKDSMIEHRRRYTSDSPMFMARASATPPSISLTIDWKRQFEAYSIENSLRMFVFCLWASYILNPYKYSWWWCCSGNYGNENTMIFPANPKLNESITASHVHSVSCPSLPAIARSIDRCLSWASYTR